MAAFNYTGYDEAGAKVSGTINAGNRSDAIQKVKDINVYCTSVEEVSNNTQIRFFSRKKVS